MRLSLLIDKTMLTSMVFSGHVEELFFSNRIYTTTLKIVSSELYQAKQETGSGAMLNISSVRGIF